MSSISVYTLMYGLLTILSFYIIVLYLNKFKNDIKRGGIIVFLCVFVIIFGNFMISFSKSLALAVNWNRLIYLASITMLLETYILICNFCDLTKHNFIYYIMMIVSLFVFLLVITGGTSITWYYKSVELVIDHNLSILVREYGPLHIVYRCYVIMMILLMVFKVVVAMLNNKIKIYVNPIILFLLATDNLFVYIVKVFINVKFDILSISYFISEIILLMLLKNENDFKYVTLNYIKEQNNENNTIASIIDNWCKTYSLTEREKEILVLLVNNISRENIANELCISEHTVKKHTTNLYEKLCVTSRNDLLYKINKELVK